MKPERRLQLDVAQWLKLQFPDVIFNVDTSGDFKGVQVAVLNKRMRSGNKWPDLWISEARGGYFGLYIELKVTTPFKQDGTLKSNPHLQAQSEMMDRLIEKGYCAMFGVGFEATVNAIKMYMSQPKTAILHEIKG